MHLAQFFCPIANKQKEDILDRGRWKNVSLGAKFLFYTKGKYSSSDVQQFGRQIPEQGETEWRQAPKIRMTWVSPISERLKMLCDEL